MSVSAEFAARLHPVVLHLPIGVFAVAATFELASLAKASLAGARRTTYCLLAVSGVLAGASGWLLGSGEDYGGALVDQHRIWGIAAACLGVLLAALDLSLRSAAGAAARRLACLACAVVLSLAGHYGGALTHGPTYLSAVAPDWLAPWLAVDVDDGEESSGLAELKDVEVSAEAGVVLQTLEQRCIECHGPNKAKGNLRLDRVDELLDTLVPGKPEESELLHRMLLPRSDEEAMPPKGPALDAAVLASFETWIVNGAPLGSIASGMADARAEDDAALAQRETFVELTHARVVPVATEIDLPAARQHLLVDWTYADLPPDAAATAALAPLATRVHELRLVHQALSHAAAEALPQLPELRRASLQQSELNDDAVRALLQRAPQLEFLNLHSTAVTPDLREALVAHEQLRKLVLFDTAWTAGDVSALRAQRPELEVTWQSELLPTQPFGDRQPRRILAADASKRRIALLREVAIGEPELLWEHEIQAIHDLQWLGDSSGGHGRVLFQTSFTDLLEVDTASGEVLWRYDAAASGDGPVEVHSFQRLEDGTTMVAESGRARVVFVDAQGAVVHSFALQVDQPSTHHDTRLVRPTPTGTFLVAHENDGVVREYDREGNVVWDYRVPLMEKPRSPGHGFDGHGNQLFAALRRQNGDTLIATGNGSSLLCVRPNRSLRWHVGQNDLEDFKLAWTTTIQELSTGNLVLGNCHAGDQQPQLIELTADGVPVWSFRDFERFGNSLSNAWVIEESR